MSQTHYVLCLYLLISKNVILPIWTLGITSFGVILMKMYSFIVLLYFQGNIHGEEMLCDVNYNIHLVHAGDVPEEFQISALVFAPVIIFKRMMFKNNL